MEKARDEELGDRGEAGDSLVEDEADGEMGDLGAALRNVGIVDCALVPTITLGNGDDGAKARGDMAEKVEDEDAESGDAIGKEEVMSPARGEAGRSALTTDSSASSPPVDGDDARLMRALPEPFANDEVG